MLGFLKLASVIFLCRALTRTCLLMHLIVAMSGCFILEQPRSSLMEFYPRMAETLKLFRTFGNPAARLISGV